MAEYYADFEDDGRAPRKSETNIQPVRGSSPPERTAIPDDVEMEESP